MVDACQIDIASLSSYHIGFVIGPCLNAGGRLETARHAVSLLLEENPGEARAKAEKLRSLNEERKDMTEKEAAKAVCRRIPGGASCWGRSGSGAGSIEGREEKRGRGKEGWRVRF